MATAVYQLPVVYHNEVTPIHCLSQAVDALEKLNFIADDVFTKILNRVKSEKNRLDCVNNRVIQLQNQVHSYKDARKSLCVISPSNYPSPSEFPPHLPPLYVPTGSKRTLEESSIQHVEKEEIFTNILPSNNKVEVIKKDKIVPPENVSSVDSLFVFNSNQSPYKKVGDAEANYKRRKLNKEKKKIGLKEEGVFFGKSMPVVGEKIGFVPVLDVYKVPDARKRLPSYLQFSKNNVAEDVKLERLDNEVIVPSFIIDIPEINEPNQAEVDFPFQVTNNPSEASQVQTSVQPSSHVQPAPYVQPAPPVQPVSPLKTAPVQTVSPVQASERIHEPSAVITTKAVEIVLKQQVSPQIPDNPKTQNLITYNAPPPPPPPPPPPRSEPQPRPVQLKPSSNVNINDAGDLAEMISQVKLKPLVTPEVEDSKHRSVLKVAFEKMRVYIADEIDEEEWSE